MELKPSGGSDDLVRPKESLALCKARRHDSSVEIRPTRSVVYRLDLNRTFKENGVVFKSLIENLHTLSPLGVRFHFSGTSTQIKRLLIPERVIPSLTQRVSGRSPASRI